MSQVASREPDLSNAGLLAPAPDDQARVETFIPARCVQNHAANLAVLANGDLALLGRSIDDVIAEPVRAPLLTGFAAAKAAALDAGLGEAPPPQPARPARASVVSRVRARRRMGLGSSVATTGFRSNAPHGTPKDPRRFSALGHGAAHGRRYRFARWLDRLPQDASPRRPEPVGRRS